MTIRIWHLVKLPHFTDNPAFSRNGVFAVAEPRKRYRSDLTDAQWLILAPLMDLHCPPINHGHPREVDLREVLNTVFYQARTGCQWDMFPHDLLPKNTVYDYFAKWRKDGTWVAINKALVEAIRMASTNAAGELRDPSPSAAAIDSQSVKGTQACENRGHDVGNEITGRKWHIAVDALGLLLAIVVTVANIQGGVAAQQLMDRLDIRSQPNSEIAWANSGYHRFALYDYIDAKKDVFWSLIIKRTDDMVGSVLLPKRWVVGRTFAWRDRWRRMSKDYERKSESAEAWVNICSIGRMLRYMAPPGDAKAIRYRPGVDQTEPVAVAA